MVDLSVAIVALFAAFGFLAGAAFVSGGDAYFGWLRRRLPRTRKPQLPPPARDVRAELTVPPGRPWSRRDA